MPDIYDIIDLITKTIDTKRKRHILGGALISISLLFGGLAVTIITSRD